MKLVYILYLNFKNIYLLETSRKTLVSLPYIDHSLAVVYM